METWGKASSSRQATFVFTRNAREKVDSSRRILKEMRTWTSSKLFLRLGTFPFQHGPNVLLRVLRITQCYSSLVTDLEWKEEVRKYGNLCIARQNYSYSSFVTDQNETWKLIQLLFRHVFTKGSAKLRQHQINNKLVVFHQNSERTSIFYVNTEMCSLSFHVQWRPTRQLHKHH